jgi:hypothetical protein
LFWWGTGATSTEGLARGADHTPYRTNPSSGLDAVA